MFEKQIKAVEDKDQKQIDALKDLKQTKAMTYKSDDNKTTTTREIYNEIVEESIDEILRMGSDINHKRFGL